MFMKDFREEAGLPSKGQIKKDGSMYFGYLSYLVKSPDETPGMRLVTMSKDFYLEFGRLSDEAKARFMHTAMKYAKQYADDSRVFTIFDDDTGQATATIVHQLMGNEHVVHVNPR